MFAHTIYENVASSCMHSNAGMRSDSCGKDPREEPLIYDTPPNSEDPVHKRTGLR